MNPDASSTSRRLPMDHGKRPGIRMVILVVLLLSALVVPATWRATASPLGSGSATSSVIPCLQVGPSYLSPNINQYSYEQEVYLYWTGTITSARLIGYEFSASGTYGRNIYINEGRDPIGRATASRGGEKQCRGFDGQQPISWAINELSLLKQGRNVIRITMDPSTSEDGWGISRAQIEVTGTDVDGRHYRQVTAPSTYFNNWDKYGNEGTWTHIMTPPGYDSSQSRPLLITAHGFGSNGLEVMLDFHDAAAARGWLMASADYHGEVWNDFYEADPLTSMPHAGTGRRTLGSRASQWDILDIVSYMQANYNVDSTRIYLAGHSMGGMTAVLTGARWADKFAAVVSDSAPTDLSAWVYETNPGPDNKGITPNASINYAILTETGTYLEPTHKPGQQRWPTDYPFEYERRSPVQYAANFRHLPLLILHPSGDAKVHKHHAEDLYLLASQYGGDAIERVYFPGQHGDRIADFANYTLDWLNGHQRSPQDAPAPLDFALDTSGSHFWISAQYSSSDLSEAHWLRVRRAQYDRVARTVRADIENLRPQNGDYPASSLSVSPPKNMNVVVTFDVARIGLPASGPYTVDLVGKDDGSFVQSFAEAASGKVAVTMPAGAYIVLLSAGNLPPAVQTLRLRQGSNGYSGVEDTYLNGWDSEKDSNFSTSQKYSLRIQEQAPLHSAVLRFDLSPQKSGLPAAAKVRHAVLNFRTTAYANNVLPLQLDVINRPWKVGEATWNRASAASAWASGGAETVPDDRIGRIMDERSIYPSSKITDRYGFDVTGLVQQWHVDSDSNRGVLLRVDLLDGIWSSVRDGFSLASSEYQLVDRRPELTIVYTTADYTPTPTGTATPTATATNTATPTATATITPTPDAGAIRGVMYLDDNRNGVQDSGEAPRADKLVQLKQGGQLLANVNTDAAGRYRFANVRPGQYQVFVSLPANYVLTIGSNPADVSVAAAVESIVDFGLATSATPTVTPTSRPVYTDDVYLPLILSGGNGG